MRDLLLAAIILPCWGMTLKRPWVGILLLAWLGYMNPNRLCYSFAREIPWVSITACLTIFATLISSEPKWIPWTRESVLLLVLILWTNVTLQFALNPEGAWKEWDRFMKIQIIIFLNLMLMKDRFRINALIWIIALSLGFFGVKGGLWAIMTGGHYRVQGPEYTFIEDNNCLALALNMTIPLMRYLQLNTENKLLRMGLGLAMALTMMAVICSYSRGGFVALAAMTVLIWIKSRKKIVFGAVLVASLAAMLSFMPEEWSGRMHTIDDYEQDNSAQGRINAWQFAMNIVSERPITGGGFRTFTPELFRLYAPNPEDHHEAHSIFFEILGEQGIPGLALFALLGFCTWRTTSKISRQVRDEPELKWAGDLMSMVQVSLAAYLVGGAFVSLAYFDFPYHLIAIVVATKAIVARHEPQASQTLDVPVESQPALAY